MSDPVTTPDWWDELAVGALLGTDRRPERPEFADLPGDLAGPAGRLSGDPAGVLLDAAALAITYRRAGALPVHVAATPDQAPADTLPRARGRAADRLGGLLLGRDLDLLVYWCEVALRTGVLAPEEALPGLLELASRQPVLRAAIVPVLGARGRWLAALEPTWARMLVAADADLADGVTAGTAGPDRAARALLQATGGAPAGGIEGADTQVDLQVWRLGTPAQRSAWLRAVRRVDPAAARAALAESWAQEPAPRRAAFITLLAENLSPADEDLLEAALDDRSRDVRAAAADLLAALPTSAYAGRMRRRALTFVRVERHLLRRRFVVDVPAAVADLDDQAARDGVTDAAGAADDPAGPRRRKWLEAVVAAAPLGTWAEIFGSPEAALESRIEGDPSSLAVLRLGWTRAAVRQRDRAWAAALLSANVQQHVDELLAVLPPGDLVPVVGRRIEALAPGQVDLLTTLLAAVPAPWPEPVAATLLTWLASRGADLAPVAARPLLNLMSYRLPVGTAPALAAAVARLDLADPWRIALANVARMTSLRNRIHEELQ